MSPTAITDGTGKDSEVAEDLRYREKMDRDNEDSDVVGFLLRANPCTLNNFYEYSKLNSVDIYKFLGGPERCFLLRVVA